MTAAFRLGADLLNYAFTPNRPDYTYSLDSGPDIVGRAADWIANSPYAERIANVAPLLGTAINRPETGYAILSYQRILKGLLGRGRKTHQYQTFGTGRLLDSYPKQRKYQSRNAPRRQSYQASPYRRSPTWKARPSWKKKTRTSWRKKTTLRKNWRKRTQI